MTRGMVSKAALAATLVLGVANCGFAATASAAPRHHRAAQVQTGVHFATRGKVHYASRSTRGGFQPLVSDGPGTGLGFHRLPGPYRIGARIHQDRQAAAVRDAVETDALTSGGFRSGFLGDSEPASGPYAAYGVFHGPDGYGSPYFAGYYGPGDGADLGILGHAYSD